MPDPIDPTQIPGADIDPDAIEENAATIGSLATAVRDNGSQVQLTWQGMAGVYSAPESGTLLGLMDPVSQQATASGDGIETVSGALKDFAADVRPIKAELESLRIQAESFVADIDGGVSVRELNPAWVSTNGTYGYSSSASYDGSWNGYGATSSTGNSQTVPQYHDVTKQWHEVQKYVDRNNDLIDQVNAQQVLLWEAERTCANKIRVLYGGGELHAAQSEDDELGYGLDEIPDGTDMPWGADVERTEGCGEATVKFVFKDFLWEGIAVGGVWGTIQGLGTLVLGYNPSTGGFFSGEAYGAAWGNLGMLAFAGMANGGILAPIFQSDTALQALGFDGFLPQELRDFKADADEVAVNTGKALLAWDEWADDPGTALGETVFNVGTILIPGGAAVAGVKTAGTAASVLSKMAKVADFVDPGAWAAKGALSVGSHVFSGLSDLMGRLDVSTLRIGDLGRNLDSLTLLRADSSRAAVDALVDDLGVDLAQITARVDGGVPVLEAPGVRVELPPGAFDDALGDGSSVRVGDVEAGGVADAGASVPARVSEPELVLAGGARAEGAAGTTVVDSIVDDAPPRVETTGGDGSGAGVVTREGDTAATGGAGGHGSGSGGDGAGSGHAVSDAGDGDGVKGGGHESGYGADGSASDSTQAGHHGADDTVSGQTDVPDSHSTSTPVSDVLDAGRDPMHNGVAGVPGEWERLADDAITPKDVHYGEPMSQHGHTTIPADPGTGRSGFDYLQDPSAPYGHHPDGTPLTAAEYDARYVTAQHNWDNYPPNVGAVRGTRVAYSNIEAFIRDYGSLLDRIGQPNGKYLGLRPDGIPASFESRGLPVSSLKEQVYKYQFSGFLPEGWRIEISEIAPAFGHKGGGVQLLVKDDHGVIQRVHQLEDAGVIR